MRQAPHLIHGENGRTFFKGYVDVLATFLTSEKKNIWLSNLRKGLFASQFQGTVHMAGRLWQQQQELGWSHFVQRQEAESK